jgi:hypothetical protein
MAKVTAPLMSMDASGKFGGALVFGKWKGRPTVRKLVTPSNPQSAGQTAVRNALRVLAAGQHFAQLTALARSGETMTDKAEMASLAPSGQAWNGFLVKSGIGAGQVQYAAATAAYAGLQVGDRTAWNTAAGLLTPAIPAVAQATEGGGSGTPLTAGEVYFHYIYALYVAGAVATVPGAIPPTYA